MFECGEEVLEDRKPSIHEEGWSILHAITDATAADVRLFKY